MTAQDSAAKPEPVEDAAQTVVSPSQEEAPCVELRAARVRRDLLPDSFGATAFADVVDRSLRASGAHFTHALSPAAMAVAYWDWILHLASAPGKQAQLLEKLVRKQMRLAMYAAHAATHHEDYAPCIEPLPQDRRFSGEAWRQWPYNVIYQNFLLQQQWWHNAATGVRGVSRQHESMLAFRTRQILDIWSPSNFIATNPEVMRKTLSSGGMNLLRGAQNLVEDWERTTHGKKPIGAESFEVGRDVAITRGKVIYRNRLIELIQYSPATAATHPEPILIVPAWIMKYYILDLSPRNSLVKYLTEQGFTVFMISWKNPGPDDRDLGMDGYVKLGVMAALDAVTATVPKAKVHLAGYCIGGTLLAMAVAAMARDRDERVKTMSLLAAQVDFTEAGELTLFINESQIALLEDVMWEQGFLDAKQMAGAFQMLRSNDLIWSRVIHDYLMGERRPTIDLVAWNADATRMPYRMHSEYLRQLFLNNDLAEGRCHTGGKAIALANIRVPIFAVGTTHDHVAPWPSVFKIHWLTDAAVTFVLTEGGHNAGIVTGPDAVGRSYQAMTKDIDAPQLNPETWSRQAPRKTGSWWQEWVGWLGAHSGAPTAPPHMGAQSLTRDPLCEAPGTYVLAD